MNNIHKQRGFVRISHELFDTSTEVELKELFANFFPISTMPSSYLPNMTEYYGLSPHFREIDEWDYAPYYDFVFERDKTGVGRFKEAREDLPQQALIDEIK